MVKVFNDNGYIWLVCYTSEHKVVFYDAQYDHCGDHGQLVSKYYADTIINSQGGLNLDGGIPEWSIAASTMDKVRAWLIQCTKVIEMLAV